MGDVYMMYYAPWCPHCQTLQPKWDILASIYKNNPNIVVGKMDATANDIRGVAITKYPAIIFYPKDNKDGISYEEKQMEVDDLNNWLYERSPVIAEGRGDYSHLNDKKEDL